MPTPKQIQSNRSNAQLSTAPPTEPGELERRQSLRQPLAAGAGSPVTDSPETENPEIGFVLHTPPPPPPMPITPAAIYCNLGL